MLPIIPRAAEGLLAAYVDSFRVVTVNGPTQGGKTTFLRLHQESVGGDFRALDDDEVLRSATEDPLAFAR